MRGCGNRRLGLLVVGRNRLVLERAYSLAAISLYEEKDLMDCLAAWFLSLSKGAMMSGIDCHVIARSPVGRRGNP